MNQTPEKWTAYSWYSTKINNNREDEESYEQSIRKSCGHNLQHLREEQEKMKNGKRKNYHLLKTLLRKLR